MRRFVSEFEETLKNQVKWIVNLKYDDLPVEIVDEARYQIISALGSIASGLTQLDLDSCPSYPGDSPLIGTDKKVTRQWAVLTLGGAMNKTEMDEGNWEVPGHVAIHFMPALLVEAEYLSRTEGYIKFKDLIVSLVAAYEITARWMHSIHTIPRLDINYVAGTIGCAVAVGKLMGLGTNELYQSMILAGSLPQAAVIEASKEGDTIRSLYAGMTNFYGMSAIDFYRMGWFSSKESLASVWSEILSFTKPDFEYMSDSLGKKWLIKAAYYNTFPGSRYAHTAVHMMLNAKLTKEQISHITRIDLYTFKEATIIDNHKANNLAAAFHSTPFMISLALIRGNLEWHTLDDKAVQDPEVIALANKVSVHIEPCYHQTPDEVRWEKIVISFDNTRRLEFKSNHAPGDHDTPLTENEFAAVFCSQTQFSSFCEDSFEIFKLIRTCEPFIDVSSLFDLLT